MLCFPFPSSVLILPGTNSQAEMGSALSFNSLSDQLNSLIIKPTCFRYLTVITKSIGFYYSVESTVNSPRALECKGACRAFLLLVTTEV